MRDRPMIVVVDDEPSARMVLTMSFEAAGYSVAAASDGEQALALIEGSRPDAVLTDIHMPRMDGDELAIRLNEKYPESLPVVVATADREVAELLRDDPLYFAVLTKPLDPEELIRVIQQAIDSRAD